jgi:glycine/D-amino acid oxidase-like deaminating enzyme
MYDAYRAQAILHRIRSHWFDTSSGYIPSEPLKGDFNIDFCVIGGGISGLSSAYYLKKLDPQSNAAVVKAEVVGFGASGRNAGQLLGSVGRGDALETLVRRYGAENLGAPWNYPYEGVQLIERLQAEEGIDCDYAPTGTMKVSPRTEGERVFDKHSALLERMGQASIYQYVDEKQGQSEVITPHFGAALCDPRGGQFNRLKLVRGVKEAAERRGAKVFENSPVAFVQQDARGILVHCGTGSIKCQKLVVASNAYTYLIEGLFCESHGHRATIRGALGRSGMAAALRYEHPVAVVFLVRPDNRREDSLRERVLHDRPS